VTQVSRDEGNDLEGAQADATTRLSTAHATRKPRRSESFSAVPPASSPPRYQRSRREEREGQAGRVKVAAGSQPWPGCALTQREAASVIAAEWARSPQTVS
jgi:hypothetical protein